MTSRPLTARDRAFLARHRALGAEDERHARGSADRIDIAADLRGETEKAYRLFDGKRLEWCPKSQVQKNGDGTFSMPEWLAKDKGFI
jgi:hypothetical protein